MPVDRSLPPDQIAYIETGEAPVSPLPPASPVPPVGQSPSPDQGVYTDTREVPISPLPPPISVPVDRSIPPDQSVYSKTGKARQSQLPATISAPVERSLPSEQSVYNETRGALELQLPPTVSLPVERSPSLDQTVYNETREAPESSLQPTIFVPVSRSVLPDQSTYVETGEASVSPRPSAISVPVERPPPPHRISYIETGKDPLSPLPLPLRTPKTPLTSVPKTPRTPLDLPPLETVLSQQIAINRQRTEYFDESPDLETAITRGFSPAGSDSPSTPSTATEIDSPSTPNDSPGLPKPTGIWRQSQVSNAAPPEEPFAYPMWQGFQAFQPQEDFEEVPWKMGEGINWRMPDQRDYFQPKNNLPPATWKTLDGQRDLKMQDKWSTARRDETHWNGSKKGFAVRMEMNLDMEIQLSGTVNGGITLSAEALYVSILSFLFFFPCPTPLLYAVCYLKYKADKIHPQAL